MLVRALVWVANGRGQGVDEAAEIGGIEGVADPPAVSGNCLDGRRRTQAHPSGPREKRALISQSRGHESLPRTPVKKV